MPSLVTEGLSYSFPLTSLLIEGKEVEPLLNGHTGVILSVIRGILTGKGILKTTTQLLKLLSARMQAREEEKWSPGLWLRSLHNPE